MTDGIIKKVCHSHNGVFHPVHLCHTNQFYSITFLWLSTRCNKPWNERKDYFFVYMAASAVHITSKEIENRIVTHMAGVNIH